MKVKTAAETAGLHEGHNYLGHFKQAKHINRGHNSNGVIDLVSKGMEAVGKAADTEKGKAIKAAEKVLEQTPSEKQQKKTLRERQIDKAVEGD
jgi:4-aminobutyrate aminotransferase-like enzyme